MALFWLINGVILTTSKSWELILQVMDKKNEVSQQVGPGFFYTDEVKNGLKRICPTMWIREMNESLRFYLDRDTT